MHLPAPILSAVFALAMTGSGFAQAALPDDAVNSANNPGSVKNEAPVREEALDCNCRVTVPGADAAGSVQSGGSDRPTIPDRAAGASDETFDCTCGQSTPRSQDPALATTLSLPGQPAAIRSRRASRRRGVRSPPGTIQGRSVMFSRPAHTTGPSRRSSGPGTIRFIRASTSRSTTMPRCGPSRSFSCVGPYTYRCG